MSVDRDHAYSRYRSTHGPSFHTQDAAAYAERVRYFERRVAHLLPAERSAPILDVACGRGEFLSLVTAQGYVSVTGIDISAEQLDAARSQGVHNVAVADLFEFLSRVTDRYEFILASHVVEHLEPGRVGEALTLFSSHLTHSGRILVITPNAGSPLGLPYAFGDLTHKTQFSATSLAQAARLAGLEVQALWGVGPDPAGWRGRIRSLAWAALKGFAMPLYGDRFMRYRVLEPEILALLK